MGKEETIVSLYRPHYQYTPTSHPVQMVATSLWSPGALPAHLQHRRHEEGAMYSFHLLHSLTSLGLPQYCQRLLALSNHLTDRLLIACNRSPSPRSRHPLFWCAGLLRLMSDKLEAKMCYYNANMPLLWEELLHALPVHAHRTPAQERYLPTLISEVSDVVCSFGSFLKDVQAFYDSVEAELASLEAFLARRRRVRIARFLIISFVCMALLFSALALTTPLISKRFKQLTHRKWK